MLYYDSMEICYRPENDTRHKSPEMVASLWTADESTRRPLNVTPEMKSSITEHVWVSRVPSNVSLRFSKHDVFTQYTPSK